MTCTRCRRRPCPISNRRVVCVGCKRGKKTTRVNRSHKSGQAR